ncbi:MAG: ABC transporter ATP-binding protein [Desulfurococcales archaeon]|nr:ABC transporter ATP-binding protein [Desulfurococcales archaeon]
MGLKGGIRRFVEVSIKEYGKGEVLRRLIKYLLARWKLLVASTAAVTLYAYTVSVTPVLIRYAIDRGVSAGNVHEALYYVGLLALATAVGGVTWYLTRYSTALLSQDLAHDLRVAAFQSIHRQSMEFFDRVTAGQLISRITNDTNRLARSLSWQVRNLVNLSFTAAMSLYFMFTMSPHLSFVVLLSMALMAGLNSKYVLMIRPLYDRIRNQLGVLASIVTSNLNGIKTVKALALESHEIQRFTKENNTFAELNIKAARIRAVYGNFSQLVLGGSMAAVLYFGGLAILNGALSIGELTAFITYLSLLMWPMRAFGFMLSAFQRALAAAKRVFEVIDAVPEVRSEGGVKLDSVEGKLEFRNVEFGYVEGKEVLKGISFKVEPGMKLFIAGPPGSGKSTILKLILRFYDFREGEILLDGIDVRKLDLEHLRKVIAYVPQEPFIFSGTIKENILFGNLEASMDDVVRAAKIAKIHNFIESLPDKYDTLVGERGITLSGGQRQRIAIARALVRNPRIILLDDPVSNLDFRTERELVGDLRDMLAGRTALIVSQRPSLTALADNVIVLDSGEVVCEGKHEDLMRTCDTYRKLWIFEGGEAL